MEKIAIIGDIHANITALQEILEDIKNRKISKIFCLGDVVSKGVNPDFVIDLIKEKCDIIIKGNCDEIFSSERAIQKKFWTTMKIGKERVEFLKSLPVMHEFYLSGKLVRLFHASPFSLEHMYNPIISNENTKYCNLMIKDYKELFKNTDFIGRNENDKIPDIIGYSHTHIANLSEFGDKTIFNPGSVGFSSDIYNASYTILEGNYNSKEISSFSITNVKVPYDVAKEIENIKKSDIPTKEDIIACYKYN